MAKLGTLSAREVMRALPEAINRVAFLRERIILTRNGKPVAAIVSLEDLDTIEAKPEGKGEANEADHGG